MVPSPPEPPSLDDSENFVSDGGDGDDKLLIQLAGGGLLLLLLLLCCGFGGGFALTRCRQKQGGNKPRLAMRRAPRNVRTDSGAEVKLSKGESALLNATKGDKGETTTTEDFYPEDLRASVAKGERSSEHATRETSVSTTRKFVSVGI